MLHIENECGDMCDAEPTESRIVLDHILIQEDDHEFSLQYKRKSLQDEDIPPSTTSIPTQLSTNSLKILQANKPTRRGKGSRPGIKTALPPTEVESSLLTHSDSTIITPAELLVLAGWMPKNQRLNEFHLSYVLKRDGASLDTVYSACADPDVSASFLIIKDEEGYVFGGYLNESLKNGSQFYGTGESFVFSIRPSLSVYRWSGADAHGADVSHVGEEVGAIEGHVTNSTDYVDMFVQSDSRQFLMGGGGDGCAIQLDDELHVGASLFCGTYNSPSLASKKLFKCVNAEVWTTKPPLVLVPLPPDPGPVASRRPPGSASRPPEVEVVLTKK